jgi:hypothetical protein
LDARLVAHVEQVPRLAATGKQRLYPRHPLEIFAVMRVGPQQVRCDEHCDKADELVIAELAERLAEIGPRRRLEAANRLAGRFAEVGLVDEQGELLALAQVSIEHEPGDQALLDLREARLEGSNTGA